MQKRIVVTLAILAFSASGITGCKKESPEKTEAPQTVPAPVTPAPATPAPSETGLTGEQLYKQYCAVCHPNGGNTITPQKTLGAKGMAERSKITKPEDIVRVMRNPGPGMNKFDEATISEGDAKKIGEYVLATFP
ncbi:MAG: cytochrome C [Geobacteraceae bacterium GWC2_58_44]|nr:MAG: cytochrome C [Geobacteraceae bacterium GWC2_58_44]HBG07072.1 cytochrome C [Geobacter sp.]